MKPDPQILQQLAVERAEAEKAAAAAKDPAAMYAEAQKLTNEKFVEDVSTEAGYRRYREQLEKDQTIAQAARVEAKRREDKKSAALEEHEELVAAACMRERMINPSQTEYEVLSSVYMKHPELYNARIS